MIEHRRHGEAKILDWEKIARSIVDAIAAKLGEDILLLDIRPVATFADYFVICSGNSERQLEALHREIREQAHNLGIQTVNSEGTGSSGWVIADLGAIVVHLFLPSARLHYDLERLWQDGRILLRML